MNDKTTLPLKPVLTLALARRLAAAAEACARTNGWNVVIALVDGGGHLVLLERMDGTQHGSVEVAMRKACTAIAFKRPTKAFEEAIAGGRPGMLSMPVLALEGGLPLAVGEHMIGAIGVSGVKSHQDGIIAAAAVEALAAAVGSSPPSAG
ncbi:MAG TPA: heme-binding protein [Burkholderiales bacterium]